MAGESTVWPPGNGEMARRIREFAWSATTLGPIDAWPQSLRTAVDLCLGSAFPSALLWGPGLTLLHNDAHVPVLGDRHPGALGRPAAEALSDTWPVLGPRVAEALAGGNGVGVPDLVATLDRGGGPRAAHLAVSFAPVRDDAGRVAGVLITAVEATAQSEALAALGLAKEQQAYLVRLNDALGPLADPDAIQAEACRLLCEHLDAQRVNYADIVGDEFVIRCSHARGVAPITGRGPVATYSHALLEEYRGGGAIAITDVNTDPRFGEQERANYARAQIAATASVMLIKDGRWVASFAAHSATPRQWTPAELELVRETAERIWAAVERARAEAALRASESRYRTIFESVDEGFAVAEVLYDAEGRPVDLLYCEANPAASRLTGGAVFAGRRASEVLPEADRTSLRIYDCVARTGKAERVERYYASFDRWYEGRISPVIDDERGGTNAVPRRVAIVFRDVTERARAEAALRESEAKYRSLFESIGEGFAIQEVVTDERGNVIDVMYLEVNGAFERISGMKDIPGKKASELLPRLEQHWLDTQTHIYKTGKPLRGELYSADVGKWIAYHFSRIGGEGSPRIGVVFDDVTERKRRERQQVFLLELADALRPLSDPVEIQAEAARVLGTHLGAARAAYAEIETDDAHFVVHRDYTDGVPSFAGRYPNDSYAPAYFADLRAGRTVTVTDAERDAQLSEADQANFAAIAVRAAVAVPLVKGGRLAAVFFLHFPTPRAWPAADVALIEETAERTWAAVERARVETALRTSEERMRLVFDNVPVQIGFYDRELRYAYVNQAGGDFFGAPPEALLGKRLQDWLQPHVFARLEPYLAAALRGERVRFEDREPDKFGPGQDGWTEETYVPYVEPDGSVNGFVALVADITERKRAEAALRASEERQAFLLDLSDALGPLAEPAEITATATQLLGDHLGVNRAFYADAERDQWLVRAGYARGVALLPDAPYAMADYGSWIIDDFAAGRPLVVREVETDPRFQPSERAALAALDIVAVAAVALIKDGRLAAMLTLHAAAPRKWTASELALLREVVERIWAAVERTRAEEALRASEARLRQALEIETVGVVFYDENGQVTGANEAFRRFVRVSRQQLASGALHWRDLTAREWWPAVRSLFAALALGQRAAPHERQFVRQNGERWWGLAAPKRLGDGRIVEYVLDVTQRKRGEAALRESEARYRVLIQNLPDYAIFMLDPDGIVTEWTEGAERITGYAAEEIIGRHYAIFFTGEERAAGDPERELAEAAATGRAEREAWRVRKDGSRFWVNEIATAIHDEAGSLTGFTKISRNLTERREAEDAVRASEERLRAIVEQATDYAIFTTDADLCIDSWLPGAEAVFGWTVEEAIGQPFDFTFTPEDRAAGQPERERTLAEQTGVAPDVRWHMCKDGRRVFIEGVSRARHGPDGEFQGLLKIGRDATERRRGEEALRASEASLQRRVAEATAELRGLSRRLLTIQEEERRRLALELHDEIGQMLTGLGFQLASAGDDARLAEARSTLGRLTEQVRQLSMDLRPSTLDRYGLLMALRLQLERYERQTGLQIELRHEGVDRRFPPPVEIAAYRIVQEALTNVARHAGSETATVILFADADGLSISVSDHGHGFDAGAPAVGSGLGGMRERAELLGGSLSIDAAPGAGVTVTAELPIETRTPAPEEMP